MNFFNLKELETIQDIKFKDFYEGAYFVSNYGHIIRYGKFRNGYTIKKPRILKCGLSKGYYTFSIRINSKNQTFRVHQVVATAFLGKMPKHKECINHKDGNKLNNHVNNLEYATHAENRKHAIECGLSSSRPNQKLSKADIENIKKEYRPTVWSNAKELSLKYNVTTTSITRIAGIYE